jgi:hypothetical protein
MILVHGAEFQALHPAFHGSSRLFQNRILASLDRLHVDADLAHADAEIASAARNPPCISARYKGFGRDAASIDAGSAEKFSLDYGDLHPGVDQAGGERWSRLSSPDYNGVKFLHFSDPPKADIRRLCTAPRNEKISDHFSE